MVVLVSFACSTLRCGGRQGARSAGATRRERAPLTVVLAAGVFSYEKNVLFSMCSKTHAKTNGTAAVARLR